MGWVVFFVSFSFLFWLMSRHLRNDGYKLKMYLSFMFFAGMLFWFGFLPISILILGYMITMYWGGKMKHVD
ncbi:MAG: hypothetical protein Kow00108_22880 [Calditrichia bacterium]